MTKTKLPTNVYHLSQNCFDAIQRAPWVYWISDSMRNLFIKLPTIGQILTAIHGTATYDNFRFLRFYWEVGSENVAFNCESWRAFERSLKSYVPYMKGGTPQKWYGNQEYVIQLSKRGEVLIDFLNSKGDMIRGTDHIFHEGITWSDLSSKGFAVRYLPPGFIFDVKGSSGFTDLKYLFTLVAIMNSDWMNYSLGLLNPTVSFQVGDISRVPVREPEDDVRGKLDDLSKKAIRLSKLLAAKDESTFDFLSPHSWRTGPEDLVVIDSNLTVIESQIDEEVFNFYSISLTDRDIIKAELRGKITMDDENDDIDLIGEEERDNEATLSTVDIAVHWISYALGIVIGRFQLGIVKALGSAVYRFEEFAISSIFPFDNHEFDDLVGPPELFAYVDRDGGRHIFSVAVEEVLRELAVPDGIIALDEEHPRDLPALVERALILMIGEQDACEVIEIGANGDLRKFLSKEYFTKHHFKMYRKRPVYWPIQSAKRSYGFVLFHEKIDKDTFYRLQRDYLDPKRKSIELKLEDLHSQLESMQGRARKELEKQIAEARELSDELAQFTADLEEITQGGYEPEPNWIDDGVILRMAPLWKVIPIWSKEPKKYWERLEHGDYDWSHIAMHYWPDRVREKCKTNKSFAIAHGLESIYEGD